MHVPPGALGIVLDAFLHGSLDCVGGEGFVAGIGNEGEGVDEGGVGKAVAGNDVQVSMSEKEAVMRGVGVEPTREVEGGLNEEEVAVGVPEAEGKEGEAEGDLEKEEDGKPLVVEVVTVAEVAVEVGEVG